MKTIKVKLYSFNELSKEAQQKAINKLATINVDFNWWNTTYEDAENTGLKITSFDLDRNKHANGKLMYNGDDVANRILKEHGSECQTYKLAERYLLDYQAIEDAHNIDEDDDKRQDDITDLENTFCNDLLELYANILQKECDYLMSEKAIVETIESNEYTFEADGRMNNSKGEQEQVLKSAWDFVENYYPNYSSSDEICRSLDLHKEIFDNNNVSSELGAEYDLLMKDIYEQAIENFINIQNK